ncbi:MAG: flavodoxin domain-containing protein [Anaerolineae bacterium]|nr:flavodoxin domain-containing protein [Anaerolineae bacterium]
MSSSILVTYATRYGSTRQVAEHVAAVLREHALVVDVESVRSVRTLEGYDAVVLGAPIYIGSLHKDAQRFLSQHRETLSHVPVAIFALGPIHDDEKECQDARVELDKEVGKYHWRALITVKVFGGKFDPSKLRFPDNLLTTLPASPLHGAPASDVRDWTAIRAWANELAVKLQAALSHMEAQK